MGGDGGKGGCGATQQVWDSEPFPFGSANHGKDEVGGREEGVKQREQERKPMLPPFLTLITDR